MAHAPERTGTGADQLDDALSALSTAEERTAALRRHLEPATKRSDLGWVRELAERVERHGLPAPSLRSLANDLAWDARDARQRLPDAREWDEADRLPPGDLRRLTLAYVHGQRLRYDFRFEPLRALSAAWLREFPDDAMIVALAAFAAIGLRATDGLELFERSVRSPDADFRSRHLCLHAMWFGHHIPDQATRLLDLSAEMLKRNETSPNLYYWRAAGLRAAARFEQALEEIDRAIGMLPAGQNSIHQDYVRERELIVATWSVHRELDSLVPRLRAELTDELRAQVEAASAKLTEQAEQGQRVVSDSLLKIVEILGLFVALLGFLIGAGAVALRAGTFAQSVVTVGLFLVGSLAFFGLLRVVVRPARPRQRR